ncbi:MAG: quinone oxidoreductase [Ornithinimicrobium sp.]
MRVVTVAEHGGPEVLRLSERDRPEAGPGQVLVEVAAAGVNFIDTYQRSGAYPMELPYVVGSEGAGTVVEVGPETSQISVGDRVAWAMVPGSGGSEYAVLPADKAVPVPAGVQLDTAAAVMLQGMTAHYLVESTYPAQAGQTALVHAAAGGVGLLLVQMLANKGVRVIGTTSTPEKAERARAAGAQEVVRYRSPGGDSAGGEQEQSVDLVAEVRRLTDDEGVDVVYDGVGRATFEAGLSLLRPRGMMVLFGAASGPVPPMDPQALNTAGSVFLTRPSLAHYLQDRDELLWRSSDVLAAVDSGELAITVGATYGLDEVADAHRDLESGGTSGKLLLVP